MPIPCKVCLSERSCQKLSNVFATEFHHACQDSQNASIVEMRAQNPRYAKLNREWFLLFNQVKNKLGEDFKLYLRLEEIQNQQKNIDCDYIYHQAFSDCIYLLQWLGLLPGEEKLHAAL